MNKDFPGADRWAAIALAVALAGCASSPDARLVPTMSCSELNGVVSTTSKDISATAVSRERVDTFNPPFWLPGVDRAKDVLVARNDRRIAESRAVQGQAAAARRTRC